MVIEGWLWIVVKVSYRGVGQGDLLWRLKLPWQFLSNLGHQCQTKANSAEWSGNRDLNRWVQGWKTASKFDRVNTGVLLLPFLKVMKGDPPPYPAIWGHCKGAAQNPRHPKKRKNPHCSRLPSTPSSPVI